MYKFSKRKGRIKMASDGSENIQGSGANELEALMGIIEDAAPGATGASPFEQNKGVEQDENRVYFYTPVTESSVLELTKILRSLDVEMQCLALRLKTGKIPIELHIHSPGGDLFSGLAAVDAIQSLKCPVHTYVEGSAASAATLMSIAGDKRFMYKHSFMLIHQISSLMVHGTHEQFKDEFENQQKLMEKIKDIYLDKTTMNEEKINDLLLHDLWLDSETCLDYGLVDKVL